MLPNWFWIINLIGIPMCAKAFVLDRGKPISILWAIGFGCNVYAVINHFIRG